MNKNKTDWTDKLRERLDDYQVAADDELWAGIEQSLVRPQPKSKQALIVGWRRWSIAAAVAALVAGGSYVYLHQPAVLPSKSNMPSVAMDKQSTSKAQPSEPNTPSATDTRNVVAQTRDNLLAYGSPASAPRLQSEYKVVFQNVAHEDNASLGSASSQSIETSAEESMVVMTNTEPEADNKQARSVESLTSTDEGYVNKKQAQQPAYTEGQPLLASATHQGHSDWSMKLYAENGFIGRMSNTDKVFSQGGVMDAPSYNNEYPGLGINGENSLYSVYRKQNHTKAKHHFPLSVGLQVGIPLMPRLKLNTGLVYTRVSSDFTQDSYDGTTTTQQTLHYVGIPLGLTYEVWGIGHLHTYVNVGAEADVNVENDTQVEGKSISVSKDRMQWSGNASIGIQYDIIPQLGIYAEPGAKYYFDNGSDIDNTFKDQKLNFNFQFGLRWNIK